MKRLVLLFLASLCGNIPVFFAQTDSAFVLRPFELRDSVDRFLRLNAVMTFDSAANESLSGIDAGEFLTSNSTAFIKDYGPGSSAVLSYRGGTAYHTKVFWEGISIDNPMLGQQDISLLLNSPQVNIDLYKGGYSLDLGSGGFGGILNIRPGSDRWTGISTNVGLSYGSFNTKKSSMDLIVGNGHFKFESSFSNVISENDYPYLDYINDNRYKKRENSGFSKTQWLPKLSWRSGAQSLSIAYWLAISERRIPSAIGTPHGNAFQEDNWNRAMLQWTLFSKYWKLHLTSAMLNDALHYDNDIGVIGSRNRVVASRSLVNFDFQPWKKIKIQTQLRYNQTKAITNNYDFTPVRKEAEVFESLSWIMRHLLLSGKIRILSIEGERPYYLPSVHLKSRPFNNLQALSFFGNASYNVRFPTFNELYWPGIHVTDLKEETSKTAEIGMEHQHNKVNGIVSLFRISAYYSVFDNLILWLPDATGTWSPENQNNVINKGLEIEGTLKVKLSALQIDVKGGYGFISSEVLSDYSTDETYRKQQVYTPKNKIHGTLRLNWKQYFIAYNQVFTDKIYTSTDNKTYLPYSHPANAEAGRKWQWKKMMVVLQFEWRNIYNENYQYVANMPMPTSNYAISINLFYN